MKTVSFIQRSAGGHWVGDGFPVRSIFSYNGAPERFSPSPSRNGRADSAVAVALGPGEESLDTALCSLGFRPLLDWWCLHLVG